MKINWGTRIAILYSGFAMLLFFMVYKATTKEFYLVTDNYYAEELAFEERMDEIRNSSSLTTPLAITYNAKEQIITIIYPLAQAEGTVKLYRPSNGKLDKTLPVEVPATQKQTIDASQMLTGMWKAQVHWEANGVNYFDEKTIVII